MNWTLPLEMQLALAAIAGLAPGMLVMWLIMRPKSNQERASMMRLTSSFKTTAGRLTNISSIPPEPWTN